MPSSLPINRVLLTGQVEDEPIVHYLAPNYPEVRLRLVTVEELPIHGGKQTQERRLWHSLVARGPVGMQLEQSVHAGSRLSISGRLDYHRETDRFGQSKTTTEILVEQIQLHSTEGRSPAPPPSASEPPPSSRFDAGRYAPSEEEDPLC